MTEGYKAIFADKQLLNYVCMDQVYVIAKADDYRTVFAYLISLQDWIELERWYHRHPIWPFQHGLQKPVMTGIAYEGLFAEPFLKQNGWIIRDPNIGKGVRREQPATQSA